MVTSSINATLVMSRMAFSKPLVAASPPKSQFYISYDLECFGLGYSAEIACHNELFHGATKPLPNSSCCESIHLLTEYNCLNNFFPYEQILVKRISGYCIAPAPTLAYK